MEIDNYQKNEDGRLSILIDKGRENRDWYVFRDQKHFGPFTYEDITDFISEGQILSNHHIWRPGFKSWRRINKIQEFSSYSIVGSENKNFSDIEFEKNLDLSIEDQVFKDDVVNNIKISKLPPLELEKIKKYKRNNYYLSGALAFILAAGTLGYVFSDRRLNSFENLNVYQKEKLTNISKTKQSDTDIRFDGFLSVVEKGDPVFVFASNLKKETAISYSLRSVKDTLVGSHRLKLINSVKTAEIFESKPLRIENGLFIKQGEYNLKVMCSTCSDKVLLEKKVKYFPKGEAAYTASLTKFNESLNSSKKLEIEELENIVNTAKKQLLLTKSNFKTRTTKRQWSKFSSTWLVNQNELISLLSQLDKIDMQEKIYHLDLYLSLKKAVQTTFELHMAQEQSFSLEKDKKIMSTLTKGVNKNELTINSIDNKVKAAQIKIKKEISKSKIS